MTIGYQVTCLPNNQRTERSHSSPNAAPNTDTLLLQNNVKSKLRQLRHGGFVHGDIRSVNVLVRKPDVALTHAEVLLVD